MIRIKNIWKSLRTGIFLLLMGSVAWNGSASPRVLVAWDPNPEPDIGGYKIYYGTNSQVYDVVVDMGNVTNAIIEDLTPGTTYYFAATAYNTIPLESDLSEEVSVTIPTGDQPPILVLPLAFAAPKETATALSGMAVTDPDGDQETVRLSLTVSRGTLAVSGSVPGGVASNQISGNGSKNAAVTASVAALAATLSAAEGVSYTGDLNLVGPDTLAVSVRNSGAAEAADSKTAVIKVTGDALDTWRNANFSQSALVDPTQEETLYGDKADPEPDGIDNLLEYALGLNPGKKESIQEAVAVDLMEGPNAENFAVLLFPRRKNQSLVEYIPEVSSDRATWNSGSGAVLEVDRWDQDSEFEVVMVQDLTPIGPDNPRYIRLRVVRNIQ